MPLPQPEALAVAKLGDGAFPSPVYPCGERFVDEGTRVLACADTAEL
jgi:hypothetical protein